MTKITLFCAIVLAAAPSSVWAGPTAEVDGSGLFSGTFGDALWTVISFVVLLAVLGKLAWRPLLNALNARQSHIEQQLKSAEDARHRAEQMLEDYKHQGLAVIQQAAQEAQRHQQEMAEKTRREVLAIRQRAQEEIEGTTAAATQELWKQAGDIILQVGGEVLGRTLTDEDDRRLLEQAVERIRHNGGSP